MAATDSRAGVTVHYDNRSVMTDTNGRYTFTGVAPGDYVVQPEATGYEFTPPWPT
jgi:protocatechuate 3,4-dioxygenase beta subunit